MSFHLNEAYLKDPGGVTACLFDFQLIITKKLEDAVSRKFDSLMRIFNYQKALDSAKLKELKEKFVADVMKILTCKYATLFKDPDLETRIQNAIPKREFNYNMEEASNLAKLLKPYKEESLSSLQQIKYQVDSLKKAEEQIFGSLQSEIAEVQAKQQTNKAQTIKMIGTMNRFNCPDGTVFESD